jgi:membrane protein
MALLSAHRSQLSYPARVASISLPDRLAPLQSPLDRVQAADPLLMSAAIAYNAFFALVPLALAAVAAISMLGQAEGLVRLEALVEEGFPEEIADFILKIVADASGVVSGWEGPVLVISLLVALYAGSRGIYAVQKALRQIQGIDDERPYWVVRGLGVLFTLGAAVALVGGYVVVLFSRFVAEVLGHFGLSVGSLAGVSSGVLTVWVAALLFAIYQWGPPVPFERALVAAVIATAVIAVMTWAAATFIPRLGSNTLAVLGVVGVVLIWLYALAMVIIVVPAFTAPAEAVIRGIEE